MGRANGDTTMLKSLATFGFLLAGLLSAAADDNKDHEEAMQKFKKGMANPSAPARAAACADLARTPFDKRPRASANSRTTRRSPPPCSSRA
jgi:hypothetical protein